MKNNIRLLICSTLVLTLLTSWNLQLKQNKCNSIEIVVKQTIKALKTKNASTYLKLFDSDKFVEWLKENPGMPTAAKLLKNPNETIESHKKAFNDLLEEIKIQSGNYKSRVKYVSHNVWGGQTEYGITHRFLEIIVEINGKSRKIAAILTEYKNCFYFFEPIDTTLEEV